MTMENISVDSVVLKVSDVGSCIKYTDVCYFQQELPYDLEISQNSKEELDKIILPPGVEDWEAWNKVVFEQGDLQILLKLGHGCLLDFTSWPRFLWTGKCKVLLFRKVHEGYHSTMRMIFMRHWKWNTYIPLLLTLTLILDS